jgi:hypothetical protein
MITQFISKQVSLDVTVMKRHLHWGVVFERHLHWGVVFERHLHWGVVFDLALLRRGFLFAGRDSCSAAPRLAGLHFGLGLMAN